MTSVVVNVIQSSEHSSQILNSCAFNKMLLFKHSCFSRIKKIHNYLVAQSALTCSASLYQFLLRKAGAPLGSDDWPKSAGVNVTECNSSSSLLLCFGQI